MIEPRGKYLPDVLAAFVWAWAIFWIVLFLSACGGTKHIPNKDHEQPRCVRKHPSQAGECIVGRQNLARGGFNYGVDISNWQGSISLRSYRFVIIQTNDGRFINPYLSRQVANAKVAGIPFGFYTFTEAYSGASQAATALAIGQKYHPTLGYWSDVEVSGAYGQACSYVNRIRQAGVHIYGVYSSPGLYFAGRCAGYDWPAEWGSGRAYPLNGYPYSATVMRQFSGYGIDKDEDLGLLKLAKPTPKPAPVPLHQVYAQRRVLRGLLTKHHCRQPPWHVAKPSRYGHTCHVWLHEGSVVNAEIRAKGGH